MILVILISMKIMAQATAFENDTGIVISKSGRLFHLRVPAELKNASRYSIEMTIPKEKTASSDGNSSDRGSGGVRKPSEMPLDKLSIEQLMIRAKRAYRKKKYDEALMYLQQAEKIDSENFRVKKMMGSVFYIMGWNEYASKYYQQSIELEPNQPKIQRALEKLKMDGSAQ